MNVYSHILQGHEATLQNAIETAQGLDFSEIETYAQYTPYLHSEYKQTINGIDIVYVFINT